MRLCDLLREVWRAFEPVFSKSRLDRDTREGGFDISF
jgi:hypothetical protein